MKILALDVGGTAIKIGVFNEKAEFLEKDEWPTNASEGGQAVMERILDIVSEYRDIDRIGISSSGQIDHKNGRVIYATDNIPGWTGTEIKKIVENEYYIPVTVENDANAAAIGEAFFGAARGQNSFICMTYGTGVGGAIMDNGEIYRGAFGSAGEFGHIITHVNGRKCTCGGKGCYEAYASTNSLINSVRKSTGIYDLNGKEVFRLLEKGDKIVKRLVDRWIKEVMTGLVSLVHIYNPSTLILGGGIMSERYILDYIRIRLPKHVMKNYRKVNILQTNLGNDAGLLGVVYCTLTRGEEWYGKSEFTNINQCKLQ